MEDFNCSTNSIRPAAVHYPKKGHGTVRREFLPVLLVFLYNVAVASQSSKSVPGIDAETVIQLARECGFELAGVASAEPFPEASYYMEWVRQGMAGEMSYLTDERAGIRSDPKRLLPSARSIICVGKLYNTQKYLSTEFKQTETGWISRYAWGEDYHKLLRRGLKKFVKRLENTAPEPFTWKACVDTSPLLERSCALRAGIGWIGKNTCLINQRQGSWFFLGVLLTSLELTSGTPAADRCGACTRCIDACPTGAIVPTGRDNGPRWAVDSRLCISYLTIEHRGSIPEQLRGKTGNHVFGCDICQDVCPWNRKAPHTQEPAFMAANFAPPLEQLAALSDLEFANQYRSAPVARSKYRGFLRNVAVAMGNSRLHRFRSALRKLSESSDSLIANHAVWALRQLK